MPEYTLEQKVLAFWSKVDKNGPIPPKNPAIGNCWIWTGCLDSKGYGTFCLGTVDGKQMNRTAHRVAWFFTYGEWPNPVGDHMCWVPACVRPAHIRAVTQMANMHNKVNKHCVRGHELKEENFYYYKPGPDGRVRRRCKLCIPYYKQMSKVYQARHKAKSGK